MKLNSYLPINKHVSAVCSAASLHSKNIGKIRYLLIQSITEKLVHAFITACLDYCNSIQYGLPNRIILRLQRIQSTAALLVAPTNRDDHITLMRKSLHWLPLQERIILKVLLFTYKTIYSSAPSYLSELVSFKLQLKLIIKKPSLSAQDLTLTVRRQKFFQCSANKLLDSVRIVRCLQSALKKHFFCNAYL